LSPDLNLHGLNISRGRDFWNDGEFTISGGVSRRVYSPHSGLMLELQR
jgi:hypothetical protein